MIDGGVGEDALEVGLRGSGPCAHDYRGDGEDKQRRADLRDLVAEERKRDAQQAVDAHLRHGAGEEHGYGRWGLSVCGGQPGVERHHGHLDGKTGEDTDGQPQHDGAEMRGDHLLKCAGGGELASWPKSMAAGGEEDSEEREQQRHGTGHGVDEELRGCGAAARASPELDEEEGGNEAEFPEQEPVEEIERGEGTEEAGLEDQDEGEVEVGLMVNAVGRIDRHEGNDGGEHEHERAEAVDAEMVFDAERGCPCDALNHAHGSVDGQVGPDEESDGEARDGGEESDGARVFGGKERDGCADEGQHGEQRQDVEAGRHSRSWPALQIRIATSATTASARILR